MLFLLSLLFPLVTTHRYSFPFGFSKFLQVVSSRSPVNVDESQRPKWKWKRSYKISWGQGVPGLWWLTSPHCGTKGKIQPDGFPFLCHWEKIRLTQKQDSRVNCEENDAWVWEPNATWGREREEQIPYTLTWLCVQPARIEELRGEVDVNITEKEKDVASLPEAGSYIKSLSPGKFSIQLDESKVPEVGSSKREKTQSPSGFPGQQSPLENTWPRAIHIWTCFFL